MASDSIVVFLSLLVFLPAVGALVLAFFPRSSGELIRLISFGITVVTFVLSVYLFFMRGDTRFDTAVGTMQSVFNLGWIPSFDIFYFMGVDGISLPLVMLTTLVSMLAMGASWSINKALKGYCILFLLLETGMIGVFLALDFFLFYVFWEVMLLPMYFLIGIWGGPRREYAAIKFFLYTLVGSVLMLVAILLLYFNSDLRTVAEASDFYGNSQASLKWSDLHVAPEVAARRLGRLTLADRNLQFTRKQGVEGSLVLNMQLVDGDKTSARVDRQGEGQRVVIEIGRDASSPGQVAEAVNRDASDVVWASLIAPAGDDSRVDVLVDGNKSASFEIGERSSTPVHTFSLLALAAQGQHTDNFSATLQWWAFLLLFVGFIIKVPSVPLHTWLPDAHVEAPTPISMILAGVLLKMGGYGIIRICYPICPDGGYALAYAVCVLGVVSMVYGAFAAMAQTDFKRLVAYSSVSHMGYVVLGLGVWGAGERFWNSDYWNMGIQGAMFQMIGHGISSAGMFFMVGIVYDRVHHRNLNEFGGLYGKMPFYTAMAMGLFFAGLGLPGLCGFIGEVLVVLSVWQFSKILAVVAAFVVILTAGYILWAIQRVYLGTEYKGPHGEALTPTNGRERSIGVALLVLAIIFGVFPYQTVLQYMDATVDRQVDDLSAWYSRRDAATAAEAAAAVEGQLPGRGEEAVPAAGAQPVQVVPAVDSDRQAGSGQRSGASQPAPRSVGRSVSHSVSHPVSNPTGAVLAAHSP